MIDVVTPAGPYRAAVAELPLSSRLGDGPTGAVVVVRGGARWVDAALAASAAGAAAVVIADPAFAPFADVNSLGALKIPVVVDRPLLRVDVAQAAADGRRAAGGVIAGPPRALVADAAATAERLRVVARDAVGWLGALAGDRLALVAADGGLALLETPGGMPAALSVVATHRAGGGSIRARALGETTTEVEVEGRRAEVTTSSRDGRLIAPTRFESHERLTLHRAVQAVVSGVSPTDLDELIADTALVEQMLLT